MLDFQGNRHITRDDWRRGTRAMALHAMGDDDELWDTLLEKFGHPTQGTIDIRSIQDLVPIDPRVSLLMKVRSARCLHGGIPQCASLHAADRGSLTRARVCSFHGDPGHVCFGGDSE